MGTDHRAGKKPVLHQAAEAELANVSSPWISTGYEGGMPAGI